jgi:general nucleoside transport system ATP-binding protein
MRHPARGSIRLEGRDIPSSEHNPHRMRQLGLLHVPEDRLRMGLVPAFPAFESAILGFSDEPHLGRGPILDHNRLVADLAKKMEQYDVRPPAPRLKSSNFSGGNQQKIVLARWLALGPRILIVDEPTRGIDVGAKAEVHQLLHRMATSGIAIIAISSELPEVLAISDRILTMRAGRITGEVGKASASEEILMHLMTMGNAEAA